MGSIKPEIDQTVRPLTLIESAIYPLSTIDQYVPKKWITRCMYFALPLVANYEEVYRDLKAGLTALISRYPMLTGKVCRNLQKRHYVAIETKPGSEVTFFFKDHTVETLGGIRLPPFAQLKEAGYPMQGIMELCAPDLIFTEVSDGSALFSAQANFVEGGLVLTIVLNHLVADGGNFNEIIRLWAEYTMHGCPSNVEIIGYDEDIVKRLSTGHTEGLIPDPRLWIEVPAEKSGLRIPPPGTPASGIVHPKRKGSAPSRAGSEIMVWTISLDRQKALKEYTSAYSTMNAIFAILWSRNVYYSEYVAKGLEVAHARMPIDVRNRMDPPIPSSYLGNTVNILAMQMATKSIDDTQATVQAVAKILRSGVTASSVRDLEVFIGTANSLPAEKGLAPPSPAVFAPCTLLNDHSRMQMHEFDWGRSLGRMDRLRDPLDDVPVRNLSAVQCYPRIADGTLEVCTLFDFEVVQKLLQDTKFLEFFQPFGRVQLEV